eukprot:3264402-Pleurochrysis_carterae.AAC.1
MDSVVRLAQHVTQHIASADLPHAALLESLCTQGAQPQALLDCCVALCGCEVALPILPTHRGNTTFGSHLFRHANQPHHTGPLSYTVRARTHSISSYAGALLGTATPGSPLVVALLAPPHDLSSPAGVFAVCAPCAASSPSTSSAGGHEETSASAPQSSLEATVLSTPPPIGARRRRSPSPASRATQPRTRAYKP